nr:helix-turn-helix domain-containing protein [Dendronalium phyllosphericum]
MRNPDTPIHDIAFVLGFSEPSAFHRDFKRWTGQTPRTY